MRPASIVHFERVYLLMIVTTAIGAALEWHELRAAAAAGIGEPTSESVQQGLVIGAVIVAFLFLLLMYYFIARRASNAAKWVFVAFAAYSVFSYVTVLSTAGLSVDLPFLVNTATLLLILECARQLFRPDAKAWLENKGQTETGDPSVDD